MNIFLSICLMMICALGHTSSPLPWEQMNPQGKAKLEVAFWDIYQAELFSSGKTYELDTPHALKLTYLRSFKVKHLVSETVKQLGRVSNVSDEAKEAWSESLRLIWQDVKKGDALAFYIDEEKRSTFYLNGRYLGAIDDRNFSEAFSAIWLSERTSRPKLRLALLGNKELRNEKSGEEK